MKEKQIQTKRQTSGKPGLRVLHAKTRRKHKAATTTAEELDGDVPSVGVGRALIVILVLHVIALGAILMHTKLNKGTDYEDPQASSDAVNSITGSKLFNDDDLKNAGTQNTDDGEVVANTSATIGNVAEENITQEEALINPLASDSVTDDLSSTAAVGQLAEKPADLKPEVVEAPLRVIAKPGVSHPSLPKPEVQKAVVVEQPKVLKESGKTYTVVSGDSIFKIARQLGVSQKDLLAINNIKNANSLSIGQILKIPSK